MNATEKKLMQNPTNSPFQDLPREVQDAMRANVQHLIRLRGNGEWRRCTADYTLYLGYIYKVDPALQATKEQENCILPVFSGSDRIYKVSIPFRHGTDRVSVQYLTTVIGMVDFAGLLYEGSDEVFTVLDVAAGLGRPRAVLFKRKFW